jgi:hypothetical protein
MIYVYVYIHLEISTPGILPQFWHDHNWNIKFYLGNGTNHLKNGKIYLKIDLDVLLVVWYEEKGRGYHPGTWRLHTLLKMYSNTHVILSL